MPMVPAPSIPSGGRHAEATRPPHHRPAARGRLRSGTVSSMLHGAGLLAGPLDSTRLMTWGLPGPGRWVTIYANAGHAYAVVAGLRLDTSGSPSGPRWRPLPRSGAGFTARHPAGF